MLKLAINTYSICSLYPQQDTFSVTAEAIRWTGVTASGLFTGSHPFHSSPIQCFLTQLQHLVIILEALPHQHWCFTPHFTLFLSSSCRYCLIISGEILTVTRGWIRKPPNHLPWSSKLQEVGEVFFLQWTNLERKTHFIVISYTP